MLLLLSVVKRSSVQRPATISLLIALPASTKHKKSISNPANDTIPNASMRMFPSHGRPYGTVLFLEKKEAMIHALATMSRQDSPAQRQVNDR